MQPTNEQLAQLLDRVPMIRPAIDDEMAGKLTLAYDNKLDLWTWRHPNGSACRDAYDSDAHNSIFRSMVENLPSFHGLTRGLAHNDKTGYHEPVWNVFQDYTDDDGSDCTKNCAGPHRTAMETMVEFWEAQHGGWDE